MIIHLSPFYDFYVVTRDRDAADIDRYPGIQADSWNQVGSASVLYCSSIGVSTLKRAYDEVKPNVINLNSLQDTFTRLAVQLRWIGFFGKTPVILAPRGELSIGAMAVKRTKKALYRNFAKLIGLHEKLHWQVSTQREREDLVRVAPAWRIHPNTIHEARDICNEHSSAAPRHLKTPGSLKLVFLSRISEMKNLHFLLAIIAKVRGDVTLNIFGPVAAKDEAYWQTCRSKLARLPANISVAYHGSLDHAEVPRVLHEHHFFILPTRGENFCHAAVESFVNGTPVILSDQTPWLNLDAAHAGFDIRLEDSESWISVLQKCVDMNQLTYSTLLEGTLKYSQRFSVEEATRQHVAMFEAALASVQH